MEIQKGGIIGMAVNSIVEENYILIKHVLLICFILHVCANICFVTIPSSGSILKFQGQFS